MEIELEITDLCGDGRGVGRPAGDAWPEISGLAVFVRGAVPGQFARVKLESRKKSYAEGSVVRILRDAPGLNRPFCKLHGKCGGCPLQRLLYPDQLYAKSGIAKDCLKKFSGFDKEFIDCIFEPPLPSPLGLACRNKMEFAFGETPLPGSQRGIVLGQRVPGTLEVISTDECPLLPQGHAAILAAMAKAAGESGLAAWHPGHSRSRNLPGRGFWRHFTLRCGGEANDWHAVCGTSAYSARERGLVRAIAEKLLAAQPQLKGFVHEEYRSNDLWRHGGHRVFALGEVELCQTICGRAFKYDAASFMQVNPGSASLLANLVLEMTEGSENGALLDLYCGVGAPGLLLAGRFGEYLGIDSCEKSIEFARENASGLTRCRYRAANVTRFLQADRNRWHTVLLDPPRAGLGRQEAENILRMNPRQIVYISCSPATFARDAAILGTRYRLERLASVDMFPHTAHIECVSRWIRREDN